jgi:hypothetical protein
LLPGVIDTKGSKPSFVDISTNSKANSAMFYAMSRDEVDPRKKKSGAEIAGYNC